MRGVCEKNSIPYCDIFSVLKNEDLEDGLHPNAAGHEKLFAVIRDFLEKNKWI